MKLNAPVAKALLGKGVLADDSPYTTGGIGHLGTAPSEFIMHACDTLLRCRRSCGLESSRQRGRRCDLHCRFADLWDGKEASGEMPPAWPRRIART
jgi:thiamine pyrophosphate-dependent enzyme